ncbi:MAG: T9SS type A sorting domain-containing protein [Saprospiraceae bacterium]|nr:T9SS type A sorting domain-containing protein [Candidatus Defluviibacterium haderslevense]
MNGATEREYTPTQSGKYQVIITNSGGCESEISDVFKYIKTTTQVDDIHIENDFKVYPNPTHSKIFLWLSKKLTENDEIIITNIVGHVVCQLSGIPINNEIDVSHLLSGIYFIELRNSNSHKMIKKCFNIL